MVAMGYLLHLFYDVSDGNPAFVVCPGRNAGHLGGGYILYQLFYSLTGRSYGGNNRYSQQFFKLLYIDIDSPVLCIVPYICLFSNSRSKGGEDY